MYVDNELVEFMPVDEKEYEEIIKEYKEEILIQEGALEPLVAKIIHEMFHTYLVGIIGNFVY